MATAVRGELHLAELPDASVRGLPGVLSVDGVLLEEQVYFVVLWVVALRNEVNGHEPGVWNETRRHGGGERRNSI